MRCAAPLLSLLLGCGGATPSPGLSPEAPSSDQGAADPAATEPPPPPPPPEEPPPPAPPGPATAAPGTAPQCPPGMVGVPGGPASLGESEPVMLARYGPNTVVPRGEYTVAPYCIDAWPAPGREGAAWPTDGLDKRLVRDTVEPLLWAHGRRLCTVAELMLAAGGPNGQRYPWGPDRDTAVCDGKDDAPSPMGTYPGCVSPTGIREVQVRSTWARLDETTLATLTAAGAASQPGFDGGYAVWGGLVRDDTYYAPTNFGVHFHLADAPGFNDDGLRTCAWSGAVSDEQQASWQRWMDTLARTRTFASLAR